MASTKITTDHEEIRRWAEKHGGKPACVLGTGGKGDIGMLRLMFPEAPQARDENLHEIDWQRWFEAFDRNNLALVYDPNSRFNKIISRETAEERAEGEHHASVHHPHGR
jgi:thiamine pyrophosphokinase